MARFFILTLAFAAIFGATLAVPEDCENPPTVQHATIEKSETDDAIRVLYTCAEGFELRGSPELICNIDTDEWNSEPPTCFEVSNEIEENAGVSERKRKILAIPEDPNVSAEMAQILDMSCIQAKVTAPAIRHGIVQKYERRRKNEKLFLVAFYACNQNFEFEDTEVNALYCRAKQWVGEIPTCIPNEEYAEEEYEEYDTMDGRGNNEADEDDEEADEEDDEDVGGEQVDPIAPPPPPPPAHDQQPTVTTNIETQPAQETVKENIDNNLIIESEEVEPIAPTVAQKPEPSVVVEEPTVVVNVDNTPEVVFGEGQASVANELPNEVDVAVEPVVVSNAVTDINIVVEPTHDPYTPRLIDDNCGPDKGGCDQKCERLLFPGENEPRLKCSCYEGFTLSPNDVSCVDIDECVENNGGCAQICNNLPGSFECACEKGFQIDTLTGNTCVDINECLLRNGHGLCQDTCHNLTPGYTCSCDGLPGTQLSPDGHSCVDAGECARNNGNCSHICLAAHGRIFCLCPSGFRMSEDTRNCQDINECEQPELAAQCAAGCVNTPGSYECVIPINANEAANDNDGETTTKAATTTTTTTTLEPEIIRTAESCTDGYRLNSDGQCLDIDECAEGLDECEYCENIPGGYTCTCPLGYQLAGDGKQCIDINECEIVAEVVDSDDVAVPQRSCSHLCENTPGSYICACGHNYHLLPDRRTCAPDSCEDLNNPQLNKTRCAHECVDLSNGRYECVCPEGYKLDADLHSCVVLESACVREDGHERCRPGTCVPSEDNQSFSCRCPPGFVDEVYACQDIDECAVGTHKCSHNCFNTEGGYQCLCPGDMLLADDGITCVANNPCAVNNNGCEQICEASEGGVCACEPGYQLAADGKSCVDIDECRAEATPNGGCQQLCRNLPGGFECICQPGYEFLDGPMRTYCFDIDECALGTHDCGAGLVCENLNGSYTCLCPAGYALGQPLVMSYITESPIQTLNTSTFSSLLSPTTTHACLDIDECSIANGNCSHFCLNYPGGFACACPPGYALDAFGFHCLDIDECAGRDYGNCTGICINLLGAYACGCEEGYELAEDKRTCNDVNECASGQHRCTHDCVNKPGGYGCACPAGYELDIDGRSCVDLHACATDHGCSQTCTRNADGDDVCQCDEGFLLSFDGKTCVSECPSGSRPSTVGNGCVQLTCALNNGGCSHNCDESYGCSCPLGLMLDVDGKTCNDINECQLNNGGCAHKCVNTFGSFECSCPEGKRLVGKECIASCAIGYTPSLLGCTDIDECTQPGICDYQCRNTPGSYECICPAGYRLEQGRKCVDIDECAVNNGGCKGGATCVNQKGGHQCRCPADKRLGADALTCEYRTDLRDQCPKFEAPANGEVRCQKYRHKRKRFYTTRCHIKCNAGYKLQGPAVRTCDDHGHWDNNVSKCLKLRRTFTNTNTVALTPNQVGCPALRPPRHGTIWPAACRQGTVAFGVSCHLQCPAGFVPLNFLLNSCMPMIGWSFKGEFDCRPFNNLLPTLNSATLPLLPTQLPQFPQMPQLPMMQQPRSQLPTLQNINKAVLGSGSANLRVSPSATQAPFIKCPQNSLIVLNQGQTGARVILEKPQTNIDYRYVSAQPAWAKNLQAHLRAGVHEIVYSAHDPKTGRSASCTTTIRIEHSAPAHLVQQPTQQSTTSTLPVSRPPIGTASGSFCTPSFSVQLRVNQKLRSVTWEEPRFEGELVKLYKSHFPGALFGLGVHPIQYEATNKDGVTMRCSFKIHVNAASASDENTPEPPRLNLPQPEPILTHQSLSAAPATLSETNLFPGHESYVICPGKQPVKVTARQSVHLPVGCTLKNVHQATQPRTLKRGLLTSRWNRYDNF